MAYVNVKDWSVEQVTEWLKGLDGVISQYTKSFLNNEVKGHQLLSFRSDDLEHLGVVILGHQEIILEAVEHLRNFHYKLDKENLQMLALRLSCTANSLYKELCLTDENCTMVPTQTMSDVHNVITAIKPLVCWLDRSPFRGNKDYVDCKTQLLQLSFEMATSAHRDIFSEKPLMAIRNISNNLAQLADHIIQEMSDPMILQPASLALATLKKKEQELGFYLLPSNYAVHQIVEIKYGSPAHNSSKIEEGDEIVQVNYQTVVGWQRKNVLLLLQESPPEIVLTLKKRPRHTKVYGQIYMKPYRLPSKKRATPYSRWNDNLPSPQLLAIHDLPEIPPPRLPPVVIQPETETEISSSSSSDSEPLDSPLDGSGRVYPLKPRPVLQRRNTITGASPTSKRPHQAIEQYWQQLRNQAASKHSSSYTIQTNKYEDESTLLRDKSASCMDSLELTPRPTTVIGLAPNSDFKKRFQDKSFKKKKVNFDETKTTYNDDTVQEIKPQNANLNVNNTNLNEEHSISVNSLTSLNESIDFIDEGEDITDRSKMKVEWQKEIIEEIINAINYDDSLKLTLGSTAKDSALADVHVHSIIKKFDEKRLESNNGLDGKNAKPKVFPKNVVEKPPELPQKPDFSKKPTVPPKHLKSKVRGTLNKSHSTPAYDQSADEAGMSPPEMPFKKSSISLKDSDSTYSIATFDGKDNYSIKYELGIPIVETHAYLGEPHFDQKVLTDDGTFKHQNIPPKPPPRTIPASINIINNNEFPPRSLPSLINCPPGGGDVCSDYNSSDYETPVINVDNLYPKRAESIESVETFEPKTVSTPVTKHSKTEFIEVEPTYNKSQTNVDSLRIASDNKISPTNSIVRAMMYSSKNKSGKKKNLLVAKRRKVNVKDVAPGELQGYLYQRSRSKQSLPAQWEKRWFVLNGSCLYGFETKDALKAKCLIFLSGFTVSVATEVKSRSHAFKVYHTGTVFYFSAENSEMLTSWIELMTAATLLYDNSKPSDSILYSESDESDVEKTKNSIEKPIVSEQPVKKFGSLKKVTPTSQSGSSSLDRKWFFNKTNSIYKNSLPVPTAQFMTYRKMPSSRANVIESSISTGNFTSHIPDFSPRFELQNTSTTNLVTETQKKEQESGLPANKMKTKTKPFNYVHASNPNLCDISDFHLRSFHKLQPFQQCSDNLAGFVTLEELMNRQSEEQKLNSHTVREIINPDLIKPDVDYGEIPIKMTKPTHSRTTSDCSERKLSQASDELNSSKQSSDSSSTSFCFGKRGSLKKHKKDKEIYDTCTYPKSKTYEEKLNRSLPRSRSSKYTNDNKPFSTKEYSVSYVDLKDHSNEMVYCPQTSNHIHYAQEKKTGKLIRQHSLTSADKRNIKSSNVTCSTDRLWMDSLRKNDRVSDKSSVNVKLKSAVQYTPMSLPLVPDHKGKLNPKFAFELNLDEKVSKTGKFKSFFVKHNESKRDKSLLGSPRLHRGGGGSTNESLIGWPSDPIQLPVQHSTLDCCYGIEEASTAKTEAIPLLNNPPTVDYPGLEYPPVFEPETYSLSNPQCNIGLLRKQDKGN